MIGLAAGCAPFGMRLTYPPKDEVASLSQTALANCPSGKIPTTVNQISVLNITADNKVNPPANILMISLKCDTAIAEAACQKVVDNFRDAKLPLQYTKLGVNAGDGTCRTRETDLATEIKNGGGTEKFKKEQLDTVERNDKIRGGNYVFSPNFGVIQSHETISVTETIYCGFVINRDELMAGTPAKQTYKDWMPVPH